MTSAMCKAPMRGASAGIVWLRPIMTCPIDVATVVVKCNRLLYSGSIPSRPPIQIVRPCGLSLRCAPVASLA
eukprot:226891-Pyramimonas_sp.AAC.1